MSSILKNIFWYPFSSKDRIEELQERIRVQEWDSFEKYIINKGSFLDVGCGAGHNLFLAQNLKECNVSGIDADPGAHGVGRFSNTSIHDSIRQGFAEDLPFESNSFDNVFCSHVIEHVANERQSLQEINRILKHDGIAIIGMPTATMAWIQLFSHYIFTTHRNILFMLKSIGKKDFAMRLRLIFVPSSHSAPRAKTICYDLNHYRIKKWKKLVASELEIIDTIKPLLYPYPDYLQFFRMRKSKLGSSSVFFICKKK